MADIDIKKTKPILSISLLASNRKATIRKCLDSLKPIMEQIDSELIIVDTGCDEETHAILLEYTTHIIPFEWCKDFSKARNAGLKQAKGEWFLFIDDDEWFSDVSEIITFFRSGDYKNYGIACYIQRNYMDYQEKRYSDSWVSRIIRLDSDTRFVSRIHEYLYPVKGICKLLHSPVKHFGYIFDSEEERYKHAERNISLLLEMIQQEKGHLRWWVQLAQEYRGIREYRKLEELCEDALNFMKRQNNKESNKTRATFYVGKILAEMYSYRYEEAERSYHKAIQDKRNTAMCQARLYCFGAEIYYKKEEYAISADCCEKYLQIYNQLKDDEMAMFEQSAFFVEEGFEELTRNSIYSWYICSKLKEQDIETMKQYFPCFNWEGETLTLQTVLIPAMMDAMATSTFDPYFVEMADTMMKREGVNQQVLSILMQKEKEAPEEYIKLAKIFAQIHHKHYFIWYTKIRNMEFLHRENGILDQEREELKEYYQKLFSCVIDIFKLDESIWEIAERYQIPLEPLFKKIPFDQWKKGIDSFCENTSLEKIEERSKLMKKVTTYNNVRYNYFALKAVEAKIVYGMGRDDYKCLRNLFYEFVEKSFAFYGEFFKTTAFEGEMELLPLSCRLAVRLKKALDSEKEGNTKQTLENLKACAGVFPSFDFAIKAYVKLYGEEKKQEEKEQEEQTKKIKNDMQKMALQIKAKIPFLIEENRVAEAADIIKQLRSYLLDDIDLDRLEHEVQMRLS